MPRMKFVGRKGPLVVKDRVYVEGDVFDCDVDTAHELLKQNPDDLRIRRNPALRNHKVLVQVELSEPLKNKYDVKVVEKAAALPEKAKMVEPKKAK